MLEVCRPSQALIAASLAVLVVFGAHEAQLRASSPNDFSNSVSLTVLGPSGAVLDRDSLRGRQSWQTHAGKFQTDPVVPHHPCGALRAPALLGRLSISGVTVSTNPFVVGANPRAPPALTITRSVV